MLVTVKLPIRDLEELHKNRHHSTLVSIHLYGVRVNMHEVCLIFMILLIEKQSIY